MALKGVGDHLYIKFCFCPWLFEAILATACITLLAEMAASNIDEASIIIVLYCSYKRDSSKYVGHT